MISDVPNPLDDPPPVPGPTATSTRGTARVKPTTRQHDSRRFHRPRGPHDHNNLQSFLLLPSEFIYPDLPESRRRQREDQRQQQHQQQSLGLHSVTGAAAASQPRARAAHGDPQSKHRKPGHDRRHKAAIVDTATIASDAAMSVSVPRESDLKDGDGPGTYPETTASPDDGVDMPGPGPFMYRRQDVTFADVKRERSKRKKLEQSNRKSLSTLAGLSSEFTRRLDATYYSLLETVASLRAGIHAFHGLTDLVSDIQADFTRDSATLHSDHKRQIADFKDFNHQVRRIELLEERMRDGREKALGLDARLAAVREKIDAWDRRESEWQARVTRRLRILWGFMGAVALLFAIVRFVEQIRPVPGQEAPNADGHPPPSFPNLSLASPNASSSTLRNLEDFGPWLQTELGLASVDDPPESSASTFESESATETTSPRKTGLELDDPLQRVLDEL